MKRRRIVAGLPALACMATARAIGLTMSPSMRLRATEVIE